MYIRANEDGIINLFGPTGIQGSVEYTGEIPGDFESLVGMGKYLFLDGEIVTSPDWIEPIPTISMEFPEGIVEVIGVPVNYKLNQVIMQVQVNYSNGQSTYKEFLADNTTIMPDGKGQFEALFEAIELGGANFNNLVRINLQDVYNQGRIF